jgi:aminopeptidase N
MANIAQVAAAFYPFVKFQNPELGKSAEEGYNWIMSSDNESNRKYHKNVGACKRAIRR